MTQSTICEKVTALLALYIDNKLDIESKNFVAQHLEVCPDCYKKFVMLQQLIGELRSAYKELLNDSKLHENKIQFSIKEYENFHTNLSAYFDNELPLNESVNMKKYMIKFPNARKSLEELYKLHKIINTSVISVKKTFNGDFSKIICYRIQGKALDLKKQFWLKIASYACLLVVIAALIGSSLPVSRTVIERGMKFFKKTIYVQTLRHNEIASDIELINE